VAGAVAVDVLDRVLIRVDDLDRQHQREELLGEVLVRCGHRAVEQRRSALLGPQLDAAERRLHGREERRATSACTSSVSAALHTPGRCILALTTIRSAASRSAEAST
jgi:hypothetical protein